MSKKCTPVWCESRFEVKSVKTHRSRITFGSCGVEKVHAVVARSTFSSQNAQNPTCSDHFWKLTCQKSARRCGAKHVLSQHVKNTTRSGHFWPCDVEKMHAVVARSTFGSENVQNTWGTDHFWTSRCRPEVEKVHASVARSTLASQK